MENRLFTRRSIIHGAALAGVAGLAVRGTGAAKAAGASGEPATLLPTGAATLATLSEKLAKAPRRRDFKSVPMILTNPDQWDNQALQEVLNYSGGPKQVWDNTDLAGPWLNLMRLSLNSQIWSFKHPHFLIASVTHGPAGLALFDQSTWAKYNFAKLTKGKFKTNTFIDIPEAAHADPADYQNPVGAFSGKANSVTVLQKRGVVFMACHDGIWELTMHLREKGHNPDKLSQEELAAELTNHLIPGVILTSDVVGELVALQQAGFTYARS